MIKIRGLTSGAILAGNFTHCLNSVLRGQGTEMEGGWGPGMI